MEDKKYPPLEEGKKIVVISRRVGESLLIGENIRVTFSSKHGSGTMRIAIILPKEVRVIREEQKDG